MSINSLFTVGQLSGNIEELERHVTNGLSHLKMAADLITQIQNNKNYNSFCDSTYTTKLQSALTAIETLIEDLPTVYCE